MQAARYLPDGATVPPEPLERPAGPPPALKSHCVIDATMAPRTGIDGQHYTIRFRLRLPENWNGRFLFQGGGGTNGNIGNALGLVPGAGLMEPAINQGYAVVSQDSGHDNASNSDPARGGPVAFGWDPEARRNYAYASLQTVVSSAKALISRFYGRAADHSYFACPRHVAAACRPGAELGCAGLWRPAAAGCGGQALGFCPFPVVQR